jgi:hypothetical protein
VSSRKIRLGVLGSHKLAPLTLGALVIPSPAVPTGKWHLGVGPCHLQKGHWTRICSRWPERQGPWGLPKQNTKSLQADAAMGSGRVAGT